MKQTHITPTRLIRGALGLATLLAATTFAIAADAEPNAEKGAEQNAEKNGATDEKATDENPHLIPASKAAAAERRARDELANARQAMERFALAPNPSAGLRYLELAERSLRVVRDRSLGLEIETAYELHRKATPALVTNLVRQAEIYLGRGAAMNARRKIDEAREIDPKASAVRRVLAAVRREEADDETEIEMGHQARRRAAERRRRAGGDDRPIPNFADRYDDRRDGGPNN